MTSSHSPLRSRASGFGLIELMISLVLGLLVLGAAFAVFQSNQATYRSNEGINRIQESARVAFELISRDLRAAGGSACSNASMVETTDANSLAFQDTPVTGSATEFTATSGDDTAYRVSDSTANSVTIVLPAGMTTATDAFKAGDLLLLCNARKTFVTEVAAGGVGTNTLTFTAPLPAGYEPTKDEFAPPAAVVIARLRNVRWYVSGNTLFVSRFGAAGEAVADGVQNLAVTYLQAGNTGYVASSAVTDWTAVSAVRVAMTLSGQFRDQDGTSKTITRTASNVVSLRSRTL